MEDPETIDDSEAITADERDIDEVIVKQIEIVNSKNVAAFRSKLEMCFFRKR